MPQPCTSTACPLVTEKKSFRVTAVTAELVTIPFSHYCEKARWALDYAKVPYRELGHAPGLHRVAVKRAGGHLQVPVLVTSTAVIADSAKILLHLDDGRGLLYPAAPGMRTEVQALAQHFDEVLGPELRRCFYFHVLADRRFSTALMTDRVPGFERVLLPLLFPVLRPVMRREMNINAQTAERSKLDVLRVFDTVAKRLSDGRKYLVGDTFTAADLTFAALSAPAFTPDEHPVPLPPRHTMPAGLRSLLDELNASPVASFVRRMYRDHRLPAANPTV